MMREVLFVQGGGEGAYAEDRALAESLKQSLGPDRAVHYPEMPDEGEPDFSTWGPAIGAALQQLGPGGILVSHSVGATLAIHYLADARLRQPLGGIFFVAAPYVGPGGWEFDDYATPADLGLRMPQGVPMHLYHADDDAIAPVAHLALYAKVLPQAVVHRLPSGGHQIGNDMSEVARDILALR